MFSIYRFVRCLRLLLNCSQYYGYCRLRSSPQSTPQAASLATPHNGITVISCTLGSEKDYASNVQSWLACKPAALIIVTIDENRQHIERSVNAQRNPCVQILSIPAPDMREQQCIAIRQVMTPYLLFVDDRVSWQPGMLQYIAAAFEDQAVGGVTTVGKVVPHASNLTIWESFGALNLVRRNILHSWLAYFLDGAVLNLAGRTSAYRTNIIQQEHFYRAMTHDYWCGRHLQRTGDDNLLTSWIIRQGWKTRFMNQPQTVVSAKVNRDATYLKQLVRWSRDTARYYIRDIILAAWTKDRSLLICCSSKIIGNYASDIALIAEVGALIIVTMLRGVALPPSTDAATT